MTSLFDVIRGGVRIFDLAQPLENGMPCSPNHPGFRLSLNRRHGDMIRPDGSSAASETIIMGGHVGTHIDALAHVSHNGHLFGALSADEAQRGGRFSELGVETIPPIVARGVLLDIAKVRGVDVLPAASEITSAELHEAADVGSPLRPGDVALIRTGWSRLWGDSDAYLGQTSGVPGIATDGAKWLAGHGILAAGADTTAFELISAGDGHRVLPVHTFFLVETGIYIIEHLNLEPLSLAGITEFLFILTPLRIVGGTGSPVRPVAVISS